MHWNACMLAFIIWLNINISRLYVWCLCVNNWIAPLRFFYFGQQFRHFIDCGIYRMLCIVIHFNIMLEITTQNMNVKLVIPCEFKFCFLCLHYVFMNIPTLTYNSVYDHNHSLAFITATIVTLIRLLITVNNRQLCDIQDRSILCAIESKNGQCKCILLGGRQLVIYSLQLVHYFMLNIS